MMKPVTTRIPEDDEQLLLELEAEWGADRSEVLRRLIHKSLDEWRRERALDALREHRVTIRQAAEMAGISYVEMITLASEEEIDIGYDSTELERDMARFT